MTPKVDRPMARLFWLFNYYGWSQQHIAAAFDVNQGRVNEVLKGHKFPTTKEEGYALYINLTD